MKEEKFKPCPKSFAAGYEARHERIIKLLDNIKSIARKHQHNDTVSYKIMEEIRKYEEK